MPLRNQEWRKPSGRHGLPSGAGVKRRHLRADGGGILAEILFVDLAVVADDEAHHAAAAVVGRVGDHREAGGYLKGHTAGDPYRGYYFRVLTRQGKSAPGGAYNYVINGRMIAGFALVAYPADYGNSGVMTFIVSHNGKVYEKDLGKDSTAIGANMSTFDPGPGWKEVLR